MLIRLRPFLLCGVLILALLLGLVIYTSLAPIGLGVSTDAVNYMFTAYNLAEGRGYISFDNTPLTWWPPLYPTLLAGIHLLTGAGFLPIVFWFNVATFIALVCSSFLLAIQIFPNRLPLVFWSTLMAAGTHVMVASAQNAGTDYLSAFLAVLALLVAGQYIRKPSPAPWVWLLLAGMLSAMQRYIGVTVIALAGLVVFCYTPGSILRKVGLALGQGLALIPLGLWAWRNTLTGTGPFGPRFPASNPLLTNVRLTIDVLTQWIIPDSITTHHILRARLLFYLALLFLVILITTGIWASYRSKQMVFPKVAVPVIMYAVIFPVALILNASVAYFKDITDRFFVPVFIPLFLTGFLGLEVLATFIQTRLPRKAAAVGLVVVCGGIPLLANWNGIEHTKHLITISQISGVEPDNLYTNRYWQENETVKLVDKLAQQNPNAVFYSNRPAGVAVYTWHTVFWAPLKFHPVFEDQTYPLGNYSSAFSQCRGACYLVWLLPHPYEHLFLPQELAQIARLEEVLTTPEGIIYRILPPG